jgi:hypothetical protein
LALSGNRPICALRVGWATVEVILFVKKVLLAKSVGTRTRAVVPVNGQAISFTYSKPKSGNEPEGHTANVKRSYL